MSDPVVLKMPEKAPLFPKKEENAIIVDGNTKFDANGQPVIYDPERNKPIMESAERAKEIREELLLASEKQKEYSNPSDKGVFNLEKNIIDLFWEPENYAKPNPEGKKAIYYGAQSSIDNDINIFGVGTTPQEAISAYVAYVEEHNINVPFKIYPITNALYEAFMCRNKNKWHQPNAVLVGSEHTRAFTENAVIGMVDLAERKYGYPSVNFFIDLQKLLYKLFIKKVNNTIPEIKHEVVISTGIGPLLHVNFTYERDKVNLEDVPIRIGDHVDATISEIEANDILFKWFYGNITTTSNSTGSSEASLLPWVLCKAIDDKEVVTSEHVFILECEPNDINGGHGHVVKTISIQYIFEVPDVPPKISLFIHPDKYLP